MKFQHGENFPLVDKASFTINNDASKTNSFYDELINLPDIIIQTDIDFIITGWNEAAEKICNLSGSIGKNIFELDNIDFTENSFELMKEGFKQNGRWNGNIRFKRAGAQDLHFRSAAHYVLNAANEAIGITIVNHNITREIIAEQKLEETEAIYKMLINTIDEGVLLIGATGTIMACNRRVTEMFSVTEEQLVGQIPVVNTERWKVFRSDGRPFPNSELPVVVSLLTGFPQKNVEMRLEKPCGNSIWLLVNSQALVREGEFNPYAVVASFADISKAKINSVF